MPFVDLGCYHCQWQKSPSQNCKCTGSIPPSCRGPSSSKLLWDGWQDYPKWCRQTQVLAFYICSCHSSAVDSELFVPFVPEKNLSIWVVYQQ